jgi:pyridoxine kinase
VSATLGHASSSFGQVKLSVTTVTCSSLRRTGLHRHDQVVKVLSIQSSVAYGYVGNSAAVFPLQRLGHEVWPVFTVHFSNHTGYGEWRGPLLAPADVADVIAGIADRGALAEVDAVLSGYQGDPAMGAVILDAVAQVKAANPAAVYCCDPVMGDVGRGMFVRPGIPEFMRDQVVPRADVITPNHFELDFLSGRTTRTLDEVLAAVDVVRDTGPRDVLVTSVLAAEDAESIDVVAVSDAGAWAVTTPLLPISPNGCGDVTAALYLAHLHTTGSPAAALGRTAASVYAVLEATLAAGTREIQLIGAQESIAAPPPTFEVRQLR